MVIIVTLSRTLKETGMIIRADSSKPLNDAPSRLRNNGQMSAETGEH